MPISKGTTDIGAVFKGTTEIASVYKGTTLVYENYKTLTADGVPPLTLEKCKNTNMLGYKVYGDSFQQTYTGKNLWNSTLIAGCMKFADGQYLNYPGYVCNATPIPVEAGQTYTISANNYDDPESTSTGYVFYNNGTFVSSLITTSLTVTIPNGVNQLYYDFRKQSSASSLSPSDITNVQFEKGSTATTYEPYVGGIKSPNPYYPQEIQSVGDKTPNLWQPDDTNYGWITITGTLSPSQGGGRRIIVEQGETYYYTNYSETGSTYNCIALYDENMNFISGTRKIIQNGQPKQNSITITNANAKYLVCAYYTGASVYVAPDWNMILKGDSSTTYINTGYKVPITISSRNVIDMTDTAFDFDEPVSMWAYTLFNNTKTKKYLKPNTTYTISYDVECTSVPEHTEGFDNRFGFFLFSGVSGYTNVILYDYGYLTVGETRSYINTFTTPANLYDDNGAYRILGYTNLYKNGDSNVESSMKFSNIQIVEGSYTAQTMPEYEPYFAPTTTSIYLNEPLRKIGSGTPQALPVGYTQLDYIESTGTQYLDTGIILTNEDFVTVKFSNSLNESYSVFGANDGTYRCQFFYNARSRYIRNFVTVNEHMLISGQVEYGVAQTYYLDLKNRQYKQGSGNWVIDTNSYQGTPQLSAFLFAQNNSGEASGIGTMKIYEYSVSRNGVEIQHLVPAKNSSGVVGMHDTIGNTFLTNQGTGTFNSAQSMYYDYIDFETQKVYRNVGHIDLSDTTYTYQSQYTRFRSNTIPGLKVITGNWTYALMSDIYGKTLAQNFNIGAQGGALFVWDNRYTDPTALKTALAGHYLNFALGATTEESITLPSILLNKGTNIVSVGTSLAPSDMWIKYKGKQ